MSRHAHRVLSSAVDGIVRRLAGRARRMGVPPTFSSASRPMRLEALEPRVFVAGSLAYDGSQLQFSSPMYGGTSLDAPAMIGNDTTASSSASSSADAASGSSNSDGSEAASQSSATQDQVTDAAGGSSLAAAQPSVPADEPSELTQEILHVDAQGLPIPTPADPATPGGSLGSDPVASVPEPTSTAGSLPASTATINSRDAANELQAIQEQAAHSLTTTAAPAGGGGGGDVGTTASLSPEVTTTSPVSNSPSSTPAAPSGLTASANGTAAQINLAWTDASDNESGFYLDQATDPSFTYDRVTTTLPADTTATALPNTIPGATYYFRIRAYSQAGTSANSNTAALRAAGSALVPGDPTNVAAMPTSLSQIRLSWSPASGASSYQIDYSTASDFSANVTRTSVAGTASSSTVGGLSPRRTYYFRLRAINASGWSNTLATSAALATGTLTREVWTGLGGGSISDLTNSPNYPNTPTLTTTLNSFATQVNWSDNYGTRVRGYLTAPATGSYSFWVAGDDNCQLYLSTDGSPANKQLIARVPDWTDAQQWDKFPQQQSTLVTLVAGQKYYIEALHKEGGGGDSLAVAWSGPGLSREVIAGQFLDPYLATSVPLTPTLAAQSPANGSVLLSWNDTGDGESGCQIQRQSGTEAWITLATVGPNLRSYSDTTVAAGQSYSYRVRALSAAGNSPWSNEVAATPSLSTTGWITREVWSGIGGNEISYLTGHPAYPNTPSFSDHLSSFATPVNAGHNDGTRVRGYLIAPVSGDYTFWIAGNSRAQLFLSGSSDPAVKQMIAYLPDWTDSQQWDKYPQQQSAAVTLVAGQKYYIEAIQKGGWGGDSLAVAWQGPGLSRQVIAGAYLEPFVPSALPAPSLMAVQHEDNAVLLSWRDRADAEAGYEVQRQGPGEMDYQTIAITPANTTSLLDQNLQEPGSYRYRVRAISGSIASEWSNYVAPLQLETAGTITREVWTGIGGGSVADLTSNPAYPDHPTLTEQLSSLVAPENWGDNYGQRLRGFVTAPQTGDYVFWVAGDDSSELWLSSDLDPAHKQRIAAAPSWTGSQEWDLQGQQRSAPIHLIAGQKYYLEALHKEAGSADSLAVAWQGPAFSRQILSGEYLDPWLNQPLVAIGGAPSLGITGTAISLTSSVIGLNTEGLSYAWDVSKVQDGVTSPHYASGSAVDFSFIPGTEGRYTVALVATDANGVRGFTTRRTINVLKLLQTGPDLEISGSLEMGTLKIVTGATSLDVKLDGTLLGSYSGVSQITGRLSDDAAVFFDGPGSLTYAGTLSGKATLSKAGSGTLTLAGANTHTGTTRISQGTLVLADPDALAQSTVDLNRADAGTLGFGALTSAHFGGLTGTRNLSLSNATDQAVALTVGSTGADTLYAGVLSGNGSLQKLGSGTLTLANADQSYTGMTSVAEGALVLAKASLAGAVHVNSGATLRLDHGYGLMGRYYNTNVTVRHPDDDVADPYYLSESVLLEHLGSLPVSLASSSLGAGDNFDFGETGQYFPGPFSRSQRPQGRDFEAAWIGSFNAPVAGAYTFATSSDDGSVLFIDGQLVVDNNSAHSLDEQSGTIILTAGVHRIVIGYYECSAGPWGLYAQVAMPGGAGQRLSNWLLQEEAAANVQVGSLSGDAGSSIELGDNTLTINGMADTLFGGKISGSGSLTKQGSAALQLSGDNTYTGGTLIAAGVLHVTGRVSGDVANSGTLIIDRAEATVLDGNISGSGRLIHQGAGALTLTGNNTYSGGTTITCGTLQVGGGGEYGAITGDVLNDGTLIFDRTNTIVFAGTVSGSGRLVQRGTGTLVFTGTIACSGGTTIEAGILQVGNGGASGCIVGNVTNHGVLTFDLAGTLDVSGVIAGSGALVQQGAGTLILSGENTYSGGTTLAGGTLSVSTHSNLGGEFMPLSFSDGTLRIGGTSITSLDTHPINAYFSGGIDVVEAQNTVLLSHALTGIGSLTKSGAGTLVLAGNCDYTGQTTVSGGTL